MAQTQRPVHRANVSRCKVHASRTNRHMPCRMSRAIWPEIASCAAVNALCNLGCLPYLGDIAEATLTVLSETRLPRALHRNSQANQSFDLAR